jgi:hypothetical protein
MEKDIIRWKDLPCLCIGKINIVKMTILSKEIYMFDAIPIKILMTFFTEIEMKTQKTSKSQSICKQKFNAGSITISYFKPYYRAIKIKTAWHWHKNRYEDQWIIIEDPVINLHSYSQLIFDKGSQNIQWRKDSLFNKCCRENWISTCRRLILDCCLSPCTNINSKWIKDFNIKPDI